MRCERGYAWVILWKRINQPGARTSFADIQPLRKEQEEIFRFSRHQSFWKRTEEMKIDFFLKNVLWLNFIRTLKKFQYQTWRIKAIMLQFFLNSWLRHSSLQCEKFPSFLSFMLDNPIKLKQTKKVFKKIYIKLVFFDNFIFLHCLTHKTYN